MFTVQQPQAVNIPTVWTFAHPARAVVPATPSSLTHPAVVQLLDRVVKPMEMRRVEEGVDITPLGLGLPFDRPRGYRGAHSDWVVYPGDQHPLIERGLFTIPPENLEHLRDLSARGYPFNQVYIADELPSGTLDRFGADDIPTELLRPPPKVETVQAAERLSERATQVDESRTRGSSGWGEAAAVGLFGGVLAGLAGLASLMTLDPLVIGAVSVHPSPRPGKDCIYLYLLTWWLY